MIDRKKLIKYINKVEEFGDLTQTNVREIAIDMVKKKSFAKAVFNDISKQFLKQYRNTSSQQIILITGYSTQKNLLALQLATERNQICNAEGIYCTFKLQEFKDHLRSIIDREVKPVGINRVVFFEITKDMVRSLPNIISVIRMYQMEIIFTSGLYIPMKFYHYILVYFGYNKSEKQFRFLVKTKGEYIGYVVLHNTLPAETIKKFDDEMDRYMNELMGRGKLIDLM